jgi:hypothetical protein
VFDKTLKETSKKTNLKLVGSTVQSIQVMAIDHKEVDWNLLAPWTDFSGQVPRAHLAMFPP